MIANPDLVERHIESLYVLDDEGRMRAINDGERTRPPRFAMVRSPVGNRCLVSTELPTALGAELRRLVAKERSVAGASPWPDHRAGYRSLLQAHAPVAGEYAGPAFVLPRCDGSVGNRARALESNECLLLRPHFEWLVQEMAWATPVAVVVEDGVAVAVCRCARQRTAAVEAGVETAPGYRGRGFAQAVTARWAALMYTESILPLYSASWDNAASLRIAESLGAEQYAVDYSLR